MVRTFIQILEQTDKYENEFLRQTRQQRCRIDGGLRGNMHNFLNKQRKWLLPTTLILFILEIIAFPLAIGFTWAGRSETPERILTYTQGKLTWDSAASIDENGAANLSLFETLYYNVESNNDDKVVAPGTEGMSIVRLKNSVSGIISYTAVLYRIRSIDILPVDVSLNGDGFEDTDVYTLPDGVKDEDIIRTVSGTLKGGMIQDFDINWNWKFYDSDEQDIVDTWLGDKAANKDADDIVVGLYIIVKDENTYVEPDVPETGDLSSLGIYIALMCVSAALLIFLFVDKKRSKKCK